MKKKMAIYFDGYDEVRGCLTTAIDSGRTRKAGNAQKRKKDIYAKRRDVQILNYRAAKGGSCYRSVSSLRSEQAAEQKIQEFFN